MKRYLYVYSDNTHGENKKEVLHSSPSYKLKKSTIYKEADGRKILTVYTVDDWTNEKKFVEQLGVN